MRPRVPIPAPVKKLLNGGLRAADEALGGVFAGGPKVEELHEFDESFDDLFEAVAASVPCTAERDAAFLRWRYGPGSSQHPVTVLGVKEGGALLGYAVLKTDATGPGGYIMDLTARPGRHDVARALVRASVRSLRRAGSPIIRYRPVPSPFSPRRTDLQRLGFFSARAGATTCWQSSPIPSSKGRPGTSPTGRTPLVTESLRSGSSNDSLTPLYRPPKLAAVPDPAQHRERTP